MKKIFLAAAALVLLRLFLAPADIMKLADVRAGMKGEGRTILRGDSTEPFTFSVLGVIENFVPGKSLIIVELDAPDLRGGGVIAGMSGSPAYIDGRIVGAVAYGFAFSKKPIAGITPIEDILRTADYNKPAYSVDISTIKVDLTREGAKDLRERLGRELAARGQYSPAPYLAPLRPQAGARGFAEPALTLLQPLFGAAQDLKISPQLGRLDNRPPARDIRPGDAVAIPLIRGDFEYSASGTVTWVDGRNIYIFGHPFFNLGSVDFPLHRAEVISVVPALDTSFKLTATRNPIGAVQQDRFSAVQGELGRAPQMIPVRLFLKNRNRSFQLEMVSHPLLTPALAYTALLNVFQSEYQEAGLHTVQATARVFVEGQENVVIEDLYSGATAADDFSQLLMAVVYYLMNNREKPARIQKIDFEMGESGGVRSVALDNVLLAKSAFLPGEPMPLTLVLRDEKGQTTREPLTLRAPNLRPGSTFFLMVADASETAEFDAKVVKANYFPASLSGLIRAINNLRKNSRVYFKMFVPREGMFIRGYEYANLPSSLSNLFFFQALGPDQGGMAVSTVEEFQYEVPGAVSGKKLIRLTIKERKNE